MSNIHVSALQQKKKKKKKLHPRTLKVNLQTSLAGRDPEIRQLNCSHQMNLLLNPPHVITTTNISYRLQAAFHTPYVFIQTCEVTRPL